LKHSPTIQTSGPAIVAGILATEYPASWNPKEPEIRVMLAVAVVGNSAPRQEDSDGSIPTWWFILFE
jgi:hypothetical protein